jgi:hypothetical protein
MSFPRTLPLLSALSYVVKYCTKAEFSAQALLNVAAQSPLWE